MKHILFLLTFTFHCITTSAQADREKEAVLDVVRAFFNHLETQDSISFRKLHVNNARFYIILKERDSVRMASRTLKEFYFRKDQIIRERMREQQVIVQTSDHIASVWAPYDLWINNKFSHCGVDVFTLVKSTEGWKIANCSYSIVKDRCAE